MAANYSKRVIIFLDFLGFKTAISELSCQDIKNIFETCLTGLDIQNHNDILLFQNNDGMHDIDFENGDFKTGKILTDTVQVSNFSDSFVLSIDDKLLASPIYPLKFCAEIQKLVLEQHNDLKIRGAISFGNIFHTQDLCYGQGLIEAYEYEKQLSYPYIGLCKSFSDQFTILDKYTFTINKCTCIDFMEANQMFLAPLEDTKFKDEIKLIKEKIACESKKETNEKVLQKLNELISYLDFKLNDGKKYSPSCKKSC